MTMVIDTHAADENSRLVLVSFTSLSMRLMDNWRQLICEVSGEMPDYEKTMILGAIITIGAEKLTRTDLEPQYQSLVSPFPASKLSKVNVASVAAAVRLNSETVRRKVSQLIDKGLVVNEAGIGLQIGPGLLELPIVRSTLRAQLELTRRTTSQLMKLDAIRLLKR